MYEGESLSSIALDYGCTPTLVKARLKRWGVDTSSDFATRTSLQLLPSLRAVNRSDLIDYLADGIVALGIASGYSPRTISLMCRYHCIATPVRST